MADPRHTRRWRKVRAQVLAGGPLCQVGLLCGGRALATTVDHLVPLDLGGAPFDPANLRPACGPCNSARGNGTRRRRARPPAPGTAAPAAPLGTSRTW